MDVLLALPRACYALAVLICFVFGGWCAFHVVFGLRSSFYAWTAAALIATILLFLSGLALARVFRRGQLISRPSGYPQCLYLILSTVAGAFGHLLVFIVCVAFYQYRYVYPERDVEGGPMAFFLMIAVASYIVALLMGEFGLRHEATSQPRIKPSNGFTDSLPANTLDSSAVDDTPK